MAFTVGVVVFPGSLDDCDAVDAAVRVDGVEARSLWHGDHSLDGVDAVVVPGGFSYGDYLRAGAIAQFSPIMAAVAKFAAAGGPVLGICNGFQVLCEAGLLPGALLPSTSLRFTCRQLDLVVENADTCFTHLYEWGERISVPAKHQTGCYFAPKELLDEIELTGQVAIRYAPGDNPNGSLNSIAGVTNTAGNVLGLMPHPEHAVDPLLGSTDGLRIFESLARSARATT